jgi:hypothetical protein
MTLLSTTTLSGATVKQCTGISGSYKDLSWCNNWRKQLLQTFGGSFKLTLVQML